MTKDDAPGAGDRRASGDADALPDPKRAADAIDPDDPHKVEKLVKLGHDHDPGDASE